MLIKKKLAAAFNKKPTPVIDSKYVSVSQSVKNIDGTKVMRIAFFENKQLVNEMFTDGLNFICRTPDGAWSNKWLTHFRDKHRYRHFDATIKDKKAICKFMNADTEKNIFDVIYDFRRSKHRKSEEKQKEKRRAQAIKKKERMNERIQRNRECVKAHENDYHEFAKTVFTHSYGIFHPGKNKKCICLACQGEYEPTFPVMSGDKIVCPRCGMKLTLYTDKKNMAYISDEKEFFFAYNDQGNTTLALINVRRSYPDHQAKYSYSSYSFQLFLEGCDSPFVYAFESGSGYSYVPRRWHEYKDSYIYKPWVADIIPVYTENLKDVFGDEWRGVPYEAITRYAAMPDFSHELTMHNDYCKNEFKRYGLEGFYLASANELKSSLTLRQFDEIKEGKSFSSVFNMLPDMRKVFVQCDVTPAEYKSLTTIKGYERLYISPEQIEQMRRCGITNFQLTEYNISLTKLLNYIEKQIEISSDITSYVMTLWRDYLDACISLNVPLERKGSIFPRDIREAHDFMMARKRNGLSKADVEASKVLFSFNEDVLKLYDKFENYSNGVYTVHFPRCGYEFLKQGDALKQCVGRSDSYRIHHVLGTNPIVFISRTLEPNRPLYTLEIKAGDIVQLRGFSNCNAPKDVTEFCKKLVGEMYAASLQREAA